MTRRWLESVFASLAAVALAACSQVPIPTPASILPPKTPPDGRLHVSVRPFVRAGSTDGYLQTPRGGKFGTSDLRRPTLGEIGISSAYEVGAEVNARWKRHGLTVEWSRFVLDGDATLAADLTSQASAFPAGTAVTSDSNLTYLGMHYSYGHELRLGDCDRIELRPGAGVRFIDVSYKLRGSNGSVADRTYTSWAPNLLLDWSWRPRDRGSLRFSGRVASTFDPVLDPKRRAYVFEAIGRAHYDFTPRISAFLETGYRHTLLDDTQPELSNRIHADFGPWIGIGFEAGF
jgi:hypothetical protein